MDLDSIYDEYLDLLVAGPEDHAVPDPETFISARGLDPRESAELLSALRLLHATRTPTSPTAPASPASPSVPPASAWTTGDGQPPAANRSPDAQRIIGDFRLIQRLGEGGMGVVWLAEDITLGRQVALKVIRGEVAMSLAANTRFEREARAVAKLHHPSIVQVYRVGHAKAGGVRYIAMEYVAGRGLDEILNESRAATTGNASPTPPTPSTPPAPIAPSLVARWGAQIARALHAAHEQQIIHRDVKPSNIHIASDTGEGSAKRPGRAMLLDFGLARDLQEPSNTGRTLTQSFVGTPDYAAPEQVGRGGGAVDARTDVYGLATVLYEALTGTRAVRGETLEQVLVSILTEDPAPIRTLRPDSPRDLSIVITKGLSKDPEHRYPTAAAFADDLEAVLELRPISARPPSALSRAQRWCARHRAFSAAAATLAFAAVAAFALFTAAQVRAAAARRAEIAATLTESATLVENYRRDREAIADLDARYTQLERLSQSGYFKPEQDREFDALESKVNLARRRRENDFHRALDLTGYAEHLGADPERVERLRADLYLERYIEADLASDPAGRDVYFSLIRAHDRDGSTLAKLRGQTMLRIPGDLPPGTELYLFRRELASQLDPAAEPRTVPVPFRADDAWHPPLGPPGSWALRLLAPAGDLREGDLIVAIDGKPLTDLPVVATENAVCAGVHATVWTRGALRMLQLPDGIRARLTAAPLFLGADSQIPLGVATRGISLEAGPYIVHARAPGHEPLTFAIQLARDGQPLPPINLLPIDTTPAGWIRVQSPTTPDSFWMMEREVTVAEYFEFLNHPTTLARLSANTGLRWEPRDNESAHGQRDADGNFMIPSDWDPQWPVFSITRTAALEYAAWRTRLAREAGRPDTFTLPTESQWVTASSPSEGDQYVWGPRFRPKWTSSCFAIPSPHPTPVRSFPIDESPCGVYDLAGSISEWTVHVWIPGTPYYKYAGGSWGTGEPKSFQIYGGNGAMSDFRGGMIGFRLVMTRPPASGQTASSQTSSTPGAEP